MSVQIWANFEVSTLPIIFLHFRRGKTHYYSFREIIKLKLIVMLKNKGMSLQKIRKGMKNLSDVLPASDDSLTRLVIFTDGVDMLVNEKGKYFSATTMQLFSV